MKKGFLFLIGLTFLVGIQLQAQSFSAFDQYLSKEVQEGRLVGVHGMVYQNGKVVYDKTYGMRDRESKDPLQGDELYFIQSMTKPIVSVALMTLYEEGKFQLDDPVSTYLPEYANLQVVNDPTVGSSSGTHPAPSSITIRQVLSHTSGMSHGISSMTYDKEIWDGIILNGKLKTLKERTEALADMPLAFDPGIKWNYSFSPDVVGRLVEVISGKDLSTYLQEEIFTPLEMKNSGYNLTEEQKKRVKVVYSFAADQSLQRALAQPKTSENTLFAGVNALFTSTADYLRFAEMMLNQGEWNGKRILKPETVALITQDHTSNIRYRLSTKDTYTRLGNGIVTDTLGTLNLEPGHGFGLGFAIVQNPKKANRSTSSKGEYFWSGANSTHFFINPKKKVVAVFMTQVASVGSPNPYGFYFGNEMRKAIYKGLE
ncbi:MAG: serine hydrolase domain-containing protein [Bacteroidota bacterium]|jgi:CubicO group peptidase (beta-lactamase class C family)|nr:beta-lactamase family protein [Algoriphagus sp.]